MTRAANKVARTVAQMPKNYNIIAGSIFDSSISTVKETIDSDVLVFNRDGHMSVSTLEGAVLTRRKILSRQPERALPCVLYDRKRTRKL